MSAFLDFVIALAYALGLWGLLVFNLWLMNKREDKLARVPAKGPSVDGFRSRKGGD